jgi:DNA-binding NtrC family response regulator
MIVVAYHMCVSSHRVLAMPARVVLVHDDIDFREQAAAALRDAGHDVKAFSGSMAALSALEAAGAIELLITRATFPLGSPNGVALARMARVKKPGIKVLFTAPAELQEHTEGLGEHMTTPVSIPELVKGATRMLAPDYRLSSG